MVLQLVVDLQLESNPGSKEALEQGCKCPVLDNEYGRGYMGGVKDDEGNTVFVVMDDCPIHNVPK